jgi:hypothetical protein
VRACVCVRAAMCACLSLCACVICQCAGKSQTVSLQTCGRLAGCIIPFPDRSDKVQRLFSSPPLQTRVLTVAVWFTFAILFLQLIWILPAGTEESFIIVLAGSAEEGGCSIRAFASDKEYHRESAQSPTRSCAAQCLWTGMPSAAVFFLFWSSLACGSCSVPSVCVTFHGPFF